jgi:hypothetical protein
MIEGELHVRAYFTSWESVIKRGKAAFFFGGHLFKIFRGGQEISKC